MGDPVLGQHTVFGPTVSDIPLDILSEKNLHLGVFPKTKFGMIIPEVENVIKERDFKSIIIVGIEVGALDWSREAYVVR